MTFSVPPEALSAFDEAIRCRDKNMYIEAVIAIDRAIASCPSHGGLHAMRGHFLAQLHNYPEAESAFRAAVELSPVSELASLGLFHARWDMDRHADAIEEARRFASKTGSHFYDEILSDFHEGTEKGTHGLNGPVPFSVPTQ